MKFKLRPDKQPQKVNPYYLKSLRMLHAQYKLKLKSYKIKTRETEEIYKQIHGLHNLIMLEQEINFYNKYAENRCKFMISEDCLKEFNNTFKHYQIHGNCCPKCSAAAYNSTLY